MHRTSLTLVVATALFAGVAHAQDAAPTAPVVVKPSQPGPSSVYAAPVTTSSTSPTAPAPTASAAPTAPMAATAPAGVTQIVYTPQLPSVAELTNAAAAQGFTIERVVQTAHQTIAFYRTAQGQATTVAYQTLPPGTGVAAPSAPPPTVVMAQPAPTVVYRTAPRVVYYDSPSYYYPQVWYPPVSLSFGIGYRGGFHHGGHHNHGRHFHHRRW